MAFDFLHLFHGKRNLMLVIVIRIADVELWRAGSVNPLVKELIYVRVASTLRQPSPSQR